MVGNYREGSSPSPATFARKCASDIEYLSNQTKMKKQSLNDLVKLTEKVASQMPNAKKWTIHNRLVELMEEVGELSNAIQTDEGFKSNKRKKSDLTDSVCDVLFELLIIAAYYKVDLDKEFPKVLLQIDDRRKKGEFDHE